MSKFIMTFRSLINSRLDISNLLSTKKKKNPCKSTLTGVFLYTSGLFSVKTMDQSGSALKPEGLIPDNSIPVIVFFISIEKTINYNTL